MEEETTIGTAGDDGPGEARPPPSGDAAPGGPGGAPLRARRVLALAVAGLAAAACGGVEDGGTAASPCPYRPGGPHRVHRVADPGRWLSDVPTWHVREDTVLGATADADSGVVLEDVDDVEAGPGGRIWVAVRGANRIRVFAPGGDIPDAVGGPGTGPGRFADLAELGAGPGDTLRAFDLQLLRESVFDSAGRHVRTTFVPRRPGFGPSPEAAYDRRGALYRLGWGPFGPSLRTALGGRDTAVVRGEVTLDRWARGDSLWRVLATVPSVEVRVTPEGIRDGPFAPRPLWDAAAGGGLWYADSRAYRLSRLSAAGDTLCRVRVDVEPPEVSDADREAYLDAGDVTPYSYTRQQRAREARREMPIPDRRPAVVRMVADDDGGVWVRPAPERWGAEPDTVTWHAFAPDGRLVARVRLPGDLHLERPGRDFVLGVRRTTSGLDQADRVVRLEVVEEGG